MGETERTGTESSSFLEELNSEIKDLSLNPDVRWLSAGKYLKQFFSPRKEIAVFLKEEIYQMFRRQRRASGTVGK